MTLPALYSQYSPSADFYTRILSSLYNNQIRLYDPDYGLLRDPDLYEKLFRDPVLAGALEMRFHDVAGRNWACEPYSDDPADREVAAICGDAMRQCDNMLTARAWMARAPLYGRTYCFIRGRRKFLKLGNSPKQLWWVPLGLDIIDKRRIDYVPKKELDEEGQSRIRVLPRVWSFARQEWEDLPHPELLIEYVYSDEEGRLGYGRPSLGEPLFFYQRFKAIAIERGLQALDRFVGGLITVNVNDNRLASVGKDNASHAQAFRDELEQMRGKHIMTVGKDEVINVHDMPANSMQGVAEWVRYFDEACVTLIRGSIRPSGGGEGGSLARTSEEAETTESLIQFDRQNLDEVFTKSLIMLFMRLNKPQLMACGFLDALDRPPHFATQQEKREDYSKNAADLKVLTDAGVPLKSDEVYSKIGYTQPGPNDMTLKTQPKPQAIPFGGGMPGGGLPPPDTALPPNKTETPELPTPPKKEAPPNA
jgi:hypothetical protein